MTTREATHTTKGKAMKVLYTDLNVIQVSNANDDEGQLIKTVDGWYWQARESDYVTGPFSTPVQAALDCKRKPEDFGFPSPQTEITRVKELSGPTGLADALARMSQRDCMDDRDRRLLLAAVEWIDERNPLKTQPTREIKPED